MAKGDTQTTNQTQSSSTSPWAASMPILNQLFSGYGGLNTSVTPGQSAAATNLTNSASAIPNFGPEGANAIYNLFSSTTNPEMGMLNGAYSSLQGNLNPTASGANLNPYSTPGFSDSLNTLTNDITNSVKGSYAASGRDPSGAGSFAQSLGRGLTQGEAPVIASQYNTNFQNMLNANNQLYGAGSNTASEGAQLGQIPLMNALQGLNGIGALSNAYTNPAATSLSAENTAYGLPFANLMQLLQPGMSLAGLGSNSTGSGTSTTTQPQNMFSNLLGGLSGGLGIFNGLGGASGLTSLLALSDERAKDDIEGIGMLNDGQKVVRFRYKGDPKMHIGLIAQQVEKFAPEAVHEFGGLKMVDHGAATDRAAQLERAA